MRIFNLFPSTPRDLTCIPVTYFNTKLTLNTPLPGYFTQKNAVLPALYGKRDHTLRKKDTLRFSRK